MGRGHAIVASAVLFVLAVLAPNPVEADYRFAEGIYLGSANLLPDWADTLKRVRRQQPALEACFAAPDSCPRHLRGVGALVERIRDLDLNRQLRVVNRYINRRHYRHDRSAEVPSAMSGDSVRVRSRWSTLAEFMRRGGDCEDYATSKYQLLRALGVAAADMRVVVVYDRDSREHHAVLAVRQPDDDGAWLLDSDDQIYRGHPFGYRFVYALNETSIWDHELDPETWARQTQPQKPPEESS
jgi:predicted transglutaminase-like cysteine proteinase